MPSTDSASEVSEAKAAQDLKERKEKLQILLKDIQTQLGNDVDRTNTLFRDNMSQFRQLLDIPSDKLINAYDNVDLNKVVTNWISELGKIDNPAKRREEYSPCELVENASGGLALKGILLGSSVDNYIKNIVLAAPSNVKLRGSSLPQIDKEIHISSKEQSDYFSNNISKLGYSVATKVKFNSLFFGVEGGFSMKRENDNERQKERHSQKCFNSHVRCHIVPMCSCELSPDTLTLSQDALSRLKEVDIKIPLCKDQKFISKLCHDFMNSYGSHVYTGPLHFGGIYNISATYTSEKETHSETTQSMTREILSAYASAAFSGIVYSASGSISGDKIESERDSSFSYDKSEKAKVSLDSAKIGGPEEVNSLPLWKMGLANHNSTWAIIDREIDKKEKFVGIWELIQNHRDYFFNYEELKSNLRSAWEELRGNHSDIQEENLAESSGKLQDLLALIATLTATSIQPKECVGHLRNVKNDVEEIIYLTGTNTFFIDILHKTDLGNFLENVVKLESKYAPEDVPVIQYSLRMLLNYADKVDFPGRDEIRKWASVKEITEINTDDKNISHLIIFLREQADLLRINKSANFVKLQLLQFLSRLMRSLESLQKHHDIFFIKITLRRLKIDWEGLSMETLGIDDLETVYEIINRQWKLFLHHSDKGQIQLESFLINFLVSSGYFEAKDLNEKEFADLAKDFKPTISPELIHILDKFACFPHFNWAEMLHLTDELSKGNMSVIKEKAMDIQGLEKVLSPRDNHFEKDKGQADLQCKASGAYYDILKEMGLNDYYPSKISVVDAINIKETNKFPWKFIHKLLMINYQCRDDLILAVNEDVNEDDLSFQDFFGVNLEDEAEFNEPLSKLSTLDMLIVLYGCCDNFLKQVLARNLHICKLAIPFLYPLGSLNNIMMSLFALRTIDIEVRDNNGKMRTTGVTDNPLPVISFIRLGRPHLSKSKLMNEVINDNTHRTFLNHDCVNGAVPRIVTDGLVECSLFISDGKDKRPDTTMFLNLRGDGSLHAMQLKVLTKISSLVLIISDVEDLAKELHSKTCSEIIIESKQATILLTSSDNDFQARNRKCRDWFSHRKSLLDKIKIITSFAKERRSQKNASELKTEILDHISQVTHRCEGTVLEDCIEDVKDVGLIVDEQDTACIKGRTFANRMMDHMKGKDKSSLLPLQGDEWLQYSKLLKDFNRVGRIKSDETFAHTIEGIKQEMILMREKQWKACDGTNTTPFISDFILGVRGILYGEDVIYFLNWVKLLLDDKSRKDIPILNKDYFRKWKQLTTCEDEQEREKLKIEVDQAEHSLSIASLGVENMLRELGQIYEVVEERSLRGKAHIQEDIKKMLDVLPDIAARLLMNGIPLELMDGDASNVPITWIKAVLAKLSSINIDKKVLVVSVLGVQSSGKSTLLNTMFGLQFSVSAGRCTKGAYLQLVPVDQSAGLPYDYVLVIDTEGLRSSELKQLKFKHDNEMTTLVIGLADVTLINIKGENTTELEDMLQICVQAFLRMKASDKHLEGQRTCVFVHQNVSAIDAEDKIMKACQNLQDTLDKMTKLAAHSENIYHIQSFNQVIKFDIEKSIWFFPDLWIGSPPMAPANTAYSLKVYDLKCYLLRDIVKTKRTSLTISDFSIRLNDLWKAILTEDFVFSFRNSLEIKAFNDLEKTYFGLIRVLENEGLICTKKVEKILEKCDTISSLVDSMKKQESEISIQLQSKYDEVRVSLENYFKDNNLQDIVEQWRQQKLNSLKYAFDEQKLENKRKWQTLVSSCRIDLEQEENKEKDETLFAKKAHDLAISLKDKEKNPEDLNQAFEEMWIKIRNELLITTTINEVSMVGLMENVLHDSFPSHMALLKAELWRYPLNKPLQEETLVITGQFLQDKHISLVEERSLRAGFEKIGEKLGLIETRLEKAKNRATKLATEIVHDILQYISDISKCVVMFQKVHAIDVISILIDKIDASNERKKEFGFTILPQFIVKLAVYVSRYCVAIFSKMQDTYYEQHGPKAKLDKYKKKCHILFFNEVKQSSEELTAADLLFNELEELICAKVRKEIPTTIVGEVVQKFCNMKHRLMVDILNDLANKGNFQSYAFYIRDSFRYASHWITDYIDKTYFEKGERGSSRYEDLTKSHIWRIFRMISPSVEKATKDVLEQEESCRTMKMWIKSFCSYIDDEIGIRESILQVVSARKVTRFDKLQTTIFEQLDSIENKISSIFKEHKSGSALWHGEATPYSQVMNKLWGCPAQCPFCNEPCYLTSKNHYSESKISHYCIQHRQQGIGNVINRDTRRLIIHSCNYKTQLEGWVYYYGEMSSKFQDHWKDEWKKADFHDSCKNYKVYFPDWDISPDPTNSVSKHWMWFMAKYKNELKEYYQSELPDIPTSWDDITKQQALDDLWKK